MKSKFGDCWKITVLSPKGVYTESSHCAFESTETSSLIRNTNVATHPNQCLTPLYLYDILLYQFSTSIYQRPLPHCLIRDSEAPLMIHSTPLGRNRYLCIISMSTNPITLPHTTQIPLPKSGNGMRSFWEGATPLVPAEIPNIFGGSSQDLYYSCMVRFCLLRIGFSDPFQMAEIYDLIHGGWDDPPRYLLQCKGATRSNDFALLERMHQVTDVWHEELLAWSPPLVTTSGGYLIFRGHYILPLQTIWHYFQGKSIKKSIPQCF